MKINTPDKRAPSTVTKKLNSMCLQVAMKSIFGISCIVRPMPVWSVMTHFARLVNPLSATRYARFEALKDAFDNELFVRAKLLSNWVW